MLSIGQILDAGSVHSVFQPIMELETGRVVAYEALARGPSGALGSPDAMFAAAREAGRLAELDEACRRAAFVGAVEAGLLAPLTLFVNVEPQILDGAPLDELLAIAAAAPGELRVVMEITERALAARPAELLRTVAHVREHGWGVALDDVGAEAASLVFMPLLRPDVVKLDLKLVQERPGPVVAEIMNAVNAYAERSGALVLAEGVENEAHLKFARALGATLGQGWLFGRPAPGAASAYDVGELTLPAPRAAGPGPTTSPFGCLPERVVLRRSPKSLLIELSKHLERQAMQLGETCLVAASFQEARHFTPSTAARFRDLVARTGFVCGLGEDLPAEPIPGLRGAALSATDPVRGEWDVVMLSPHFSAALLARDLRDDGPDMKRMFEYALTYERSTVVQAAHALVSRVLPREGAPGAPVAPLAAVPALRPLPGTASVDTPAGESLAVALAAPLMAQALAASSNGVTIADMLRPDQPLVYANAAFEALAGFRAEQILGRNCRFLQGPDTDKAVVARVRAAIAAGTPCQVTMLNYRGPQRTPWWNELRLTPVTDETGRVVQYIAAQSDVTARVAAERALLEEKDRSQGYATQLEQLAGTDLLTGLANRRSFEEQVELALWDVRAGGGALALLFLDLDRFKVVNDLLGHAAGDELLVLTAARLQARLRRGDLLARLGGDQFLVVLPGLDGRSAREHAAAVAAQLSAAVAAPATVQGREVTVSASIGISISPADATDLATLLHLADERMSAAKHPSPDTANA